MQWYVTLSGSVIVDGENETQAKNATKELLAQFNEDGKTNNGIVLWETQLPFPLEDTVTVA